MHELSVIQSIVGAIVDELGDTKVARVRLVVGMRAGVVVDAPRFSVGLVTDGTPPAGAALELDEPDTAGLRIVSVGRCWPATTIWPPRTARGCGSGASWRSTSEERVPATDTSARTPLGGGESTAKRAEEYGAEGEEGRETLGTKGESDRPFGTSTDEDQH